MLHVIPLLCREFRRNISLIFSESGMSHLYDQASYACANRALFKIFTWLLVVCVYMPRSYVSLKRFVVVVVVLFYVHVKHLRSCRGGQLA